MIYYEGPGAATPIMTCKLDSSERECRQMQTSRREGIPFPQIVTGRIRARIVRREAGAGVALYNQDLRRIAYNRINKPTFSEHKVNEYAYC